MSADTSDASDKTGFAGVLEASLRVSAAAEAPFESYREAPPPEAPAAAGVLILWCAAGVLLCLGLAALRLSETPPAAQMAVVGAAALGLLVLGALGAAALFHFAAHFRGADAPFERSLLLVALVSPLIPMHLSVFWAPIPYLWLLTTVYSAWLCSRGLVRMGLLPERAAAALLAVLGLSYAGIQGLAAGKGEGVRRELQEEASPGPSAPPPSSSFRSASPRSSPPLAPPRALSSSLKAAGPSSGLDMVQKNEEMGAVPGQDTAFSQESETDSAKRLRSLDRWSERLGVNGDLTEGLPAEQKVQILSMKQTLDRIREEAKKTGVVPTKEEVLMRVLMQAGGSRKSAAATKKQPAKKARKAPVRKHRVVEEDDGSQEGSSGED